MTRKGMTRKECLMVLMLAGLPALSMAQAGGSASAIGAPLNCQGLVGGAMALCMQGIGTGRSATEAPRQAISRESSAPAAPREAAQSGADYKGGAANSGSGASGNSIGASISSAVSGLLSGWGSSPASKGTNCQGLVGGAMSQCMQGMGTGSGSASVGSGAAVTTAAADSDAGSSVSRNFTFGGNSLNCQGLSGAALAHCLQGVR